MVEHLQRLCWCGTALVLLHVAATASATVLMRGSDFTDREVGSSERSDEAVTVDLRDLPWQVALGLRVRQIEQAFPLIDRVVLVQDHATFVDEISRWSPTGRWPVLIEDDHLTPMFIRRFQPAEVIRRESAGSWPDEADARKALLQTTLIRTFGGSPETDTLSRIFQANNYVPPGIVITSVNDPAWPAALALAAGRVQPLGWLDRRLRPPNAAFSQDEANVIAGEIEAQLELTGHPWRTLEQTAVNTITICRAMGGRVNAPRPDNNDVEPLAITDYLGRHEDGERFAVVGWIFGDEVQSAYIAMCSLFLPRTRLTFIDTYPNEAGFRSFAIDDVPTILKDQQYELTTRTGADLTRAGWLRDLAGGLDADVISMNSRGNATVFHVNDGEVSSLDVPTLNTPAAVHFVHSWSMRAPTNEQTVAAQWLQRGAYAYVGSVHEPFLSAFLPPRELARRWMRMIPFLVAARHEGAPMPFGGPWRVNTFGDPLMLCAPPPLIHRDRIRQPTADGTNLLETARQRMQAIDEENGDDALVESIQLLALLGRDELVINLWAHAKKRGIEQRVAHDVLDAMFRKNDHRGFFDAWKRANIRDDRTLTMLWHIYAARLQSLDNDEDLLLMQSAVRTTMPEIDLERLMPHLARRFSRAHIRSLLERELDRTDNARSQRAIRRLMRDVH